MIRNIQWLTQLVSQKFTIHCIRYQEIHETKQAHAL